MLFLKYLLLYILVLEKCGLSPLTYSEQIIAYLIKNQHTFPHFSLWILRDFKRPPLTSKPTNLKPI